MPTLEHGGEMLHYEEAGQGPALLLLHSLGTGGWLWREQIRHWSATHRVVVPDMRGHGASSHRTGITMEANASDVVALMEALGLREAAIVGLSMGGVIATRVAALAPARVRALVLADTFCHQPEGPARVAGIEARLAAMDMPAFARAYAEETLMPASRAAHLEALSTGIARTSAEAYLASTRSLFLEDTRALLGSLAQPLLVLWGDHDQRTPRALSEDIVQASRQVRQARLEVLAGAAHLSNLDRPEAFHAAVDRFIRTDA